jgi:signal transduction histidine kinase/ActR/RegA family two-component response regulator
MEPHPNPGVAQVKICSLFSLRNVRLFERNPVMTCVQTSPPKKTKRAIVDSADYSHVEQHPSSRPLSVPAEILELVFNANPSCLVLVQAEPNFTIVAASDSYIRATSVTRDFLIGKRLFDAFPDELTDPERLARNSLMTVLRTATADTIPSISYNIPANSTQASSRMTDSETDGEVEMEDEIALNDRNQAEQAVDRVWCLVNIPILNPQTQELEYILQCAEELTDVVQANEQHKRESQSLELLKLSVQRSIARMNSQHRLKQLQTTNHRLFDELEYMRSHLEELVVAQMAELERTHAQLRLETQARHETSMAMEEAKVKSSDVHRKQLENLVDTICHEVRNPLNGIFGSVDVIRSCLLTLWNIIPTQPSSPTFALNSELDQSLSLSMQSAQLFDQKNQQQRHDCNLNPLLLTTSDAWQEIRATLRELQDATSIIDECAMYQKCLVNDVLDLSKLEASGIVLDSKPFDPKQVLETVLKIFRSTITRKRLNLIVQVPENSLGVIGDPHRVSQILANLMSNAVKFTTSGSISIAMDISLDTETQNVDLHVCVTDTGIGISQQDGTKLFSRFAQASRRVGDKIQGSGLGLAISKQLAELMNGQVWFTSEVGTGSSFHVNLRLPHSSLPEPSSPIGSEHDGFKAVAPIRALDHNLTALIVEDNTTNQKILARMISKVGMNCEIANHGLEALEWLERRSFDLIFMDVQMPVMDGLEATRAIREREKLLGLPAVPIVGVSADARAEHKEIAISSGMTDYVTKPYQREHILTTIKSLLLDCHSC